MKRAPSMELRTLESNHMKISSPKKFESDSEDQPIPQKLIKQDNHAEEVVRKV